MVRKYIRIVVTSSCNLNCIYCYRELIKENKQFLDIDKLKEILENAGIRFKLVTITGGEPFIHPNLKDIIEITRKYTKKLNVTTNGTLIIDNFVWLYPLLKEDTINTITISLDTLNPSQFRLYTETSQKLFKKVIVGLSLLSKEFSDKIIINSIITKQNLYHILEYFIPFMYNTFKIKTFKLIPLIKEYIPHSFHKEVISERKIISILKRYFSEKDYKFKIQFSEEKQMYRIIVYDVNQTFLIPKQIYDNNNNYKYRIKHGWFIITPNGKLLSPTLEEIKPIKKWWINFYYKHGRNYL